MSDVAPSLEVIIERLNELNRKLDKVTDDHETRLRRLEAWSYALPVAIMLSLGSVAAAIIGAILNR